VADRQNHALAVVVMDLDHFKQVIDRWGHHAGDAVLVHIAMLLRNHLRASDRFASAAKSSVCSCLWLTTTVP
jgi:diguanylate cyclase (GGDEF)-like protein